MYFPSQFELEEGRRDDIEGTAQDDQVELEIRDLQPDEDEDEEEKDESGGEDEEEKDESGGKSENDRIKEITGFDFALSMKEVDSLVATSENVVSNARGIKKMYNMYNMSRLLLSKEMEESLSDSDGGLTGKDKIVQV